jgi:hypothetical protein
LCLAVALAAPTVGVAVADVLTAHTAGAGVSANPTWQIKTSGWDRSSSPTIGDVNGDGVPDVVIGHQDGLLRVVSGATGAELPGWPQKAIVSGTSGTAIDSSPSVADLNRDGKSEIVVGVGSTWVQNQPGGVIVFNPNGTRHCVFHTMDHGNIWHNNGTPDGYSDEVFSSPAIGDINGDGYPDIAFGAFDLNIYAIDRNCNLLMKFNQEDSTWSSPVLYDINGDGRDEILIGADQTAGGIRDWTGGEFRALQWQPGGTDGYNTRNIWTRRVNEVFTSSPALGDIDNDGRLEVVVGTGFATGLSDSHKVFAFHADDGSTVPGWPVTTGGNTLPSPALGDLNGDGVPEVVVSSGDGYVRAYYGNGRLMWAKQLTFNNTRPGGGASSPIIADVNGDGQNDVVASNDWAYHILNGANGALMGQVNKWLSSEAAAAVGNFGPAGWKLIVNSFNTPEHRNVLSAYDMPAPRKTPPWPMFHQAGDHRGGPIGKALPPPGYCRRPGSHGTPSDASSHGYWVAGATGSVYAFKGAPYVGNANGRVHGRVVGMGQTSTGNGYYLLDSAGVIFPFGDARSYGSMAGRHLNAPIIALAPTPTGRGYWLLGRDGGVFTFGDARFKGSTGGHHLNAPIISMTSTRTGNGYFLLASDGGVFTFGDAHFKGSTGGHHLNAPIISMAASPSGTGYWLIARDGGIFSFGVPFYGSLVGLGLCSPPPGVQIRPTLTGRGYFLLAATGSVWPFGDAKTAGNTPPLTLSNLAVDLVVRK